ncbi:Nucleotide-binding universal stress protein, UspA family [Saccharicrinis carchari]|uniref:Universal stress protein n=1 Tax=Saccharicrinis carchari TaxID=1168039 RepID=A0A521F3D8_SACCC|nr:universal stress protein [Saccharicrinis carchari]SMO90131.1 Nucleotide-binding universal stress protein, UspA family [Saccharicrinis carchari]
MKNILVAVDLKEGTDKVLTIASDQARQFKAKLWIVHIAAPEPDFVGYQVGPQYIRDMRATELKGHHRKLKKLSDERCANGIDAESLLINGGTVEMLTAETEKLHIDLIVIGHHKHGFIHKTFFGQTDVSLIENTQVPTLIVPN